MVDCPRCAAAVLAEDVRCGYCSIEKREREEGFEQEEEVQAQIEAEEREARALAADFRESWSQDSDGHLRPRSRSPLWSRSCSLSPRWCPELGRLKSSRVVGIASV